MDTATIVDAAHASRHPRDAEAPPAAPPVLSTLSPESFRALADATTRLLELGQALKPATRIPVTTTFAEAVGSAGRALAIIHRDHKQLGDDQLLGWGARALRLASMGAAAAVTCLAELHDREVRAGAAVRQPAPPRPARGTTPPAADPTEVSDDGGESLWLQPNATPGVPPFSEPTCTACGCTQGNACHDQRGRGCAWAELDTTTNAGVCTACRREPS